MAGLCLGLQLFSATFMLITTVLIKILFGSVHKSKTPKKNTISFKSLNILYISWMFINAVPFGLKMVEIVPFAVSAAGNSMLLSFLVANAEAREYFQTKLENWKLTRKDQKKIQLSMNTHLSTWAEKRENITSSVHHVQNVFVIDI
jgi:hypothetical protein